jgi:hypothetical protein
MKRLATVLAVLVTSAFPSIAQSLDGRWVGTVIAGDGGRVDISTVITGDTYISNSVGIVGGYSYESSHSGNVVFIPPNTLRLVVVRTLAGAPTHNGNYTILSLTADKLTVLDNVCTMTGTPQGCTFTFQRQ